MDADEEAVEEGGSTTLQDRWDGVTGKVRPFREVIMAALLLALFGYLWLDMDAFISGRRGQALIDPDFWPELLLGLSTVLAAVYLLRAILDARAKIKARAMAPATVEPADAPPADAAPPRPAFDDEIEAGDVTPPPLGKRIQALAGFLLLALYIYLMPTLGFVPITVLFAVTFLLLLGERRWWFLIALPLGIAAAVIGVFTQLLVVPLPRGTGMFLELSTYLY